MKKIFSQQGQNYYLGLDIGTDSVGWAVTDLNYKLLRVNNKNLWGVRLFDEAQQASARRLQRESRRRLERRRLRVNLLQQIFAPAINAKDSNFFARLDDSNLYGEDKREKTKFSLFSDTNFTDIDFHKKYKTFYHLRAAMMSEANPDPRMVYLALHHIVKYRGHFLIEGESMNAVENIAMPIEEIKRYLADRDESNCNDCFDLSKTDSFRELLVQKVGKTTKANSFAECFSVEKHNKKFLTVLKLVAGCSVSVKDLPVECDDEKLKICFDGDWENQETVLREALQDDYVLIENAKLLFDYSQFKAILGNHKYLSQGMAEKYKKHEDDLKALKYVLRKYFSKEKYDDMFRNASDNNHTNYTAYSGRVSFGRKNGKKVVLDVKSNSREYDDFIKYVKEVLSSSETAMQDEVSKRILTDIEKKEFMPKQVSKNNATLPYQLNLAELDAILENASKYSEYAFLNEKDEDGISARVKIRSLLTFRMPYYVGPVNNSSGKYWIVKKDDGRIMPWNYEQKIDLEQTERNFIERMTNACSYFPKEKVLPKCSLLYEEYVFLNIVNKIKINGEPIPVSLKQRLSDYYAETGANKLSKKFLKRWLIEENVAQNDDDLQIEGFDDGATVHRRTFYQFVQIFGSKQAVLENLKDIEEIVKYATISGSEKSNLEKWLVKNYKYLQKEQIKRIKGLTCKGWGRCSQKFLITKFGTNPETGEVNSLSVMDVLRDTTLNFMELWNDEVYGFSKAFDSENNKSYEEISYSIVGELYCSPAVKKQIWQALTVVKELRGILGCAPSKIFVEVARGSDSKKDKLEERKRTTSRYEQLKKVFEDIRRQNDASLAEDVYDKFVKVGERKEKLQNQKLYLYFLQNGLDAYTGEPIDYNHLELYDKDHIYPRSKVKDDSIHNNLVLTYRPQNAVKRDDYPISEKIRNNPKVKALWKTLRAQGLMTEEKYKRLTRTTELRDDEMADFINRQLVETRQSTKEVIGVLKRVFADSEIVWSKASNVSDFRALPKRIGEVSVPRFVKCRELNDLHHAKDAYLNIVVGNTFNVRYGHNAKYWVKEHPTEKLTSSAKIYECDVKTQKVTAWIAGDNGTMAQVEKTMRSNAVLFTRESKVAKGALFNATIEKKDEKGEKNLVPLKNCSSNCGKRAKMSQTSKYGGYNSESRTYYMLVKYVERKERKKGTVEKVKYKFLGVTAKDAHMLTDDASRVEYCENFGLTEPIILLDKIKIHTMFEFKGTRLTLAGMTGNRLVWRLAQQNVQDEETERYLKKVINVLEKRKKDADYKICDKDGVSEEQNLILYNSVVNTLLSPKYAGSGSLVSFAKKLSATNLMDKFKELSVEKQCVVLGEICKVLQCNALASDLSLLGEGKTCGKILTQSTLDNLDEISVVHRSVSGLFEKKIPLYVFDK